MGQRRILIECLIITGLVCLYGKSMGDNIPPIQPLPIMCGISAYLSPTDNVEQAIRAEIANAKSSIYLSLYGIENERLASDLINAKNKGIDIVLCVDRMQSQGHSSLIHQLSNAGITIIIKGTHALEHNKFAIIDGQEVIMGSWNWSNNAQKQDNSDVIIKNCPDVVNRFVTQFNWIKNRDKPQ